MKMPKWLRDWLRKQLEDILGGGDEPDDPVDPPDDPVEPPDDPVEPPDDPVDPPDDPVEPPDDPIEPPEPGKVVEVWTGPTRAYKLVGMLGTKYGLFVTISNVYKGANRSEVYLNGKKVYPTGGGSGTQETIGQPFEYGDAVYFPVEHGKHVLKWKNGQMTAGARTKGRWSVCGTVWNGKGVVPYNNRYSGVFQDNPLICDVRNGDVLKTLPVKSMPRSFCQMDGKTYCSCNFGQNVLVCLETSKVINSPMYLIAAFNGKIYGGGGVDWGPPPRRPDGRVYRYDGRKIRAIGDTGCASIQAIATLGGRLYIAGIDPDRLFVMGPDEKLVTLAEKTGETAADKARDFGAGVALHEGKIYWGRSSRTRAHVYRLDGQQPIPGDWVEYVYEVDVEVEQADGLVGSGFVGATADIELVLAGPEKSFEQPVGKKFMVSGTVKKVADKDGKDITSMLQGNTEMKPTEYVLESRNIRYEIDNERANVVGTAVLSDDLGRLDDVDVRGGGKGANGSIARDVVATGSGTLSEVREGIPGPVPGPNPPDDGSGHTKSKTFKFQASERGEVSLETAGIKHQNGPNKDGGWEYIFLSLFGKGFNRVLLFHAGGGGRKTRYYIEHRSKSDAVHRLEVATDNLPGWHRWTVKWENRQIKFFLDGRQIGHTEVFKGVPTRAIAGGYTDSRRDFRGRWRNFASVT